MLSRIARYIRRFFRTFVLRNDRFAIAHRRWVRDNAEHNLRVDYPLDVNSVVLDVGGYNGDWAAVIHERYGCRIHIFEPVPEFHQRISERFKDVPQIQVHRFGLADADTTMPMTISADGSSVYQQGQATIEAQLRDVDAFLREQGIDKVDLMKINIEGGEFALLSRMLDRGIVPRCGDLQVQFHDFYPNAVSLREELRRRLAETHELTYDYYFVWENWRRRASR